MKRTSWLRFAAGAPLLREASAVRSEMHIPGPCTFLAARCLRIPAAAVLLLGTCRAAPAHQQTSLETRASTARAILGAPTGAIVALNPGTCAFTQVLAHQLDSLVHTSRYPAVVVFFGIADDSSLHRRIRQDLRLKSRSFIASTAWAEEHLGVPKGGVPTIVILRKSEIAVLAFGDLLRRLPAWLPGILPSRIGD